MKSAMRPIHPGEILLAKSDNTLLWLEGNFLC